MHESFVASGEDTLDGKPIYKEGGIGSMYALVSIDGKIASSVFSLDDYLVSRGTDTLAQNLNNSFGEGEHNVFITDGIEKLETSLKIDTRDKQSTMTFGRLKNLKGSPSIGSIFTVTVDRGASFIPTKLQIATPVNVVNEVEDIVDDILSNAGLDYNKSTIGNKYYMSANFTGQKCLCSN